MPSSAQRRETPIETMWELIQTLMQRKTIQVTKSAMSAAKLLAIKNGLDQQNWKLEAYETQEDSETIYLRAFNWIVDQNP